MSFDSVKTVIIDARGGHKFIVASIVDNNGNNKLVVRANQDCEYHSDILDLLREEVLGLGLRADCVGGGNIDINPDEKTIFIWDRSGDFGRERDRNNTVKMLSFAFPEFSVEAG